jgi:hypothetical protein
MSLNNKPLLLVGKSSAVLEEIGSGYPSVTSFLKSPHLRRYGKAVMHDPAIDQAPKNTSRI